MSNMLEAFYAQKRYELNKSARAKTKHGGLDVYAESRTTLRDSEILAILKEERERKTPKVISANTMVPIDLVKRCMSEYRIVYKGRRLGYEKRCKPKKIG